MKKSNEERIIEEKIEEEIEKEVTMEEMIGKRRPEEIAQKTQTIVEMKENREKNKNKA